MMTTLPDAGLPREDILGALRAMSADDFSWQDGRLSAYAFASGQEAERIARDAFFQHFSVNALGARRAFPGLRRMEAEVVSIGLQLLRAPAGAAGFMTTGGTESILAAVRASRNAARARPGRARHRGNIVAPATAHPAFTKAADLMDLDLRRVPVGGDYRSDASAMAAAMDGDTIMLVGSAPCFPYGVIDRIDELSELALARDAWLHVDACVGGYIAPFARMLGHPVPDFDLALPGVRSLSADLHKFGYCPKPASTVFYRRAEDARHQAFEYDDWPSGRYVTDTVVGTRPGAAVAAAWAMLHAMGRDGYLDSTRRVLDLAARYRQRYAACPGLRIVGQPHLSLMAVAADDVDLHRVGECLKARGWLPGMIRAPRGLHHMLSLLHEAAIEPYFRDFDACLRAVRDAGGAADARIEVLY